MGFRVVPILWRLWIMLSTSSFLGLTSFAESMFVRSICVAVCTYSLFIFLAVQHSWIIEHTTVSLSSYPLTVVCPYPVLKPVSGLVQVTCSCVCVPLVNVCGYICSMCAQSWTCWARAIDILRLPLVSHLMLGLEYFLPENLLYANILTPILWVGITTFT